MKGRGNNPLLIRQVEADMFMAYSAIKKAESLSSKAGSFIEVRQDIIYNRQ